MEQRNTRKLLGAFIRAHRERTPSPNATVGRRRTPGMRREELAEAAGLGVSWITCLEQGRSVNASVGALSRLAHALQLSPAERTSLFDLAGRHDPDTPRAVMDDFPASLLALPSLFPVPAYLLDHTWTARAWNSKAAQLFHGWLDADALSRNLLHYVFLSPVARKVIVDWALRAYRIASEFRADFNRRPLDQAMQTVVEYLLGCSTEFVDAWGRQGVLNREGGERDFLHPAQGFCRFIQITLHPSVQKEAKLVCLIPSSDEDLSGGTKSEVQHHLLGIY